MIHMPLPTHFQSSNRNLPRRVDSLQAGAQAVKNPYFIELDDELRDIRRVHSQGQEEDLRYALSRTINRIEELSSKLKEAYKAQTDLQTELTLAKSNLQMALANNEMLEDALKRDPGHSKDVGWRRISAREQTLKAAADAERRRSAESLASTVEYSPTLSQPSPHPDHSPIAPRSATMPSPAQSTEGRFFRFRFGSGNGSGASSPRPSSPRLSAGQSPILNGPAHLTSASLPSLVHPRDIDKEFEAMQSQLETERKAHKAAAEAKVALEAELESLSQALFEEANKMVATERMKRAETEEALREAREQGEALKNVLRLFERDSAAASARRHVVDAYGEEIAAPLRTRHRASSSAVGIKSPSSGIPTPRSRPSSPAFPESEQPLSAKTVTAETPPTISAQLIQQAEPEEERSAEPTGSLLAKPAISDENKSVLTDEAPSSLHITPAPPSDSPSPSPSPIPSPLSAPGQFLFTPARAVNYYDGEESPWADATSSASPKIVT